MSTKGHFSHKLINASIAAGCTHLELYGNTERLEEFDPISHEETYGNYTFITLTTHKHIFKTNTQQSLQPEAYVYE